ncbi:uncharacterized protein Z519_05024 [Cladophialophora bantiana CBS 173.52]|uniref:Uncharacterized protein n=1 Tax=Cladophialophora bantiana (strain ATCC 10958 / CBS 173.52 / CDC B-1940 / NIH 8579) TaxID=1442370 RepID=A0A0D2HS57_CLAB1|nr:uncharacterized protein Z519_05024 [Cladophialophora bantiana CBS 173.52]KIW93710.1 hypothetical protein Z519_05024 [Cladophialophora bantiana CBS 173.52]
MAPTSSEVRFEQEFPDVFLEIFRANDATFKLSVDLVIHDKASIADEDDDENDADDEYYLEANPIWNRQGWRNAVAEIERLAPGLLPKSSS